MKNIKFLNKRFLYMFLLIIIIGTLVRVIGLSNNPYGFFCDEASIGYNAYTILKHGTDEYGTPFPVFFKAFGEYKSPVNIYSAVPFIAILGLNEYSVRLFAATYGVLTLIVFYLLAKELFDKKIAFISMLLLAISPWHIHISRIAFENISYLFWLTLSILLFLYGLKRKWLLIMATFSFAISVYTYTPARVVVPLFFVFFLIVYAKRLIKKSTVLFSIISICVFVVLMVPLVLALLNGNALSRWNQLTVTSLGLSPKDTVIHIATAYFNYFSPTFLFTKGDIDFPKQFITRHSIRGMGELYLFQIPLLLVGLFYLIKNYKRFKFQNLILLFWLVVYPASAALTIDANPQATRGLIGVIPFSVISAIGLCRLIKYIKNLTPTIRSVLTVSIYLIITFSFIKYTTLLTNYPSYSADYWGFQYGPKEMINYFLANKNDYDEFYMASTFNAPEIFLKFYILDETTRSKTHIGGLDNIKPNKKQLFGVDKNVYDSLSNKSDFTVVSKVYYPNYKIAFYMIRLNDH